MWCDDIPLKYSFASLFTFANANKARADDIYEVEEGIVALNLASQETFVIVS